MTIFRTAYDTFVGKVSTPSYEITDRMQDIEVSKQTITDNAALLSDLSGINNSEHGFRPSIVTNRTPLEISMGVFFHPTPLVMPGVGKSVSETWLVGDARPFLGREQKQNGAVFVSNIMEFELLVVRLGLGSVWLRQDPTSIKYLSPITHSIYASWIAENITRRFMLDMGQQMRIQVLASYFYYCLFSGETEMGVAQMHKIAAVVAKAAKAPVEEALAIISKVGHITSIIDLVTKIKLVIDNPRVEALNAGVVATIISGTWFGFGGKEIACVALEHPPTFMAMVYIALVQRGYKNAAFCSITERYKGPKGGDDYLRAVRKLIFSK